MKQWYKNNITKGILLVLEHILAIVAIISFLWVATYPTLLSDLFTAGRIDKYEDSHGFGKLMQNVSSDILQGISISNQFETEGKYDPERIVDVKEFSDKAIISNENSSGLAYRLGDLVKWSESDGSAEMQNIVVCERADGTYRYYYFDEFQKLINDGQLQFILNENAQGAGTGGDQILSDLQGGYAYQSSEPNFKGIQDSEGKVEYVNCWSYDGYQVDEKIAPIGAKNLLDIVNENPDWNGKLSEASNLLDNATTTIYDMYQTYENLSNVWKEGDTNLVYLYMNKAENKIYTNREEYKDYSKMEESLASIKKNGKYLIVKPKLSDFETNLENMEATSWRAIAGQYVDENTDFIYAVGVDTKYPVQDEFYNRNNIYEKYGSKMQMIAVAGGAAAILFLTGLVWLTIIAGRNGRDEEVHLNWFDRWKTEIAAIVLIAIWMIPLCLAVPSVSSGLDGAYNYGYTTSGTQIMTTQIMDSYGNEMVLGMTLCGAIAAYVCAGFTIGYLSLVRRIKAKTVWKNSCIRSLYVFIKELFANMHFVWKTVILSIIFIIFNWAMFSAGTYEGWPWIIALIVDGIAFVYLIRMNIARQKIRVGIEHIASGEVNYKIPLDGLRGESWMLAERVNSIGDGLDAAVEESLKSERLKTDLITNVSHDIKTPLTSIINYIDLLKKENFEDEQVQHYLQVLEKKAQRLKTLTEDVVEASKVSSGNITLECMNINLVEMIQQTSGEFAEKFAAKKLTEILSLPEEEVLIKADGRRMWRVLENIYNNAAKYAMEGTRIYADLRVDGDTIRFSLKNVSEYPLNFTADELTERFLRGDVSRSTEGSGLGLSIAKSLTTMQGGTFDLYLDGDLFKVTITFPRVIKQNVDN